MRNISKDDIKKDLDLNFKDHSLIQIDNHYFAVFDKLEIISKSSANKNKEILSGKVLPIFFSNKYFHMLLDNVSLAEYSKSIIDNLKIQIFVVQYPIHEELSTGDVNSSPESFLSFLDNKRFDNRQFIYDDTNNFEYFKDISLIYNNKSFFYGQTMNVEIEKCFTFIGDDLDLLELYNSDPEVYLHYYFGDGSRDYSKAYTDKRWVIKGIHELKNKLKHQYKIEAKGKKTYISRIQASKLFKDNQDEENFHRIFENELIVEGMFKNNGFDIVSFEGMPFIDQYEIINESSEIAGYNGTNLLNTILSQNPIKVIEVKSSNSKGYFDYNKFSNIFKNNHTFLQENDIMDVNNLEIWR